MTDTTEETVIVDGVTLNTFAYNIQTLSGRGTTPSKRRSNRTVPFRPGSRWVQKHWGEKHEVWGMWVRGSDVDGVAFGRSVFNDNVETLTGLFGINHRVLNVTRRKRLASGLVTRTAEVELDGEMDLRMRGPNMASLSVDMRFMYPFWEGPEIAPAFTGPATHTNEGQVEQVKMVVRLEASGGSAPGPGITNISYAPDLTLSYNGTLNDGQYVDIDVLEGTAIHSASGDVSGEILHSGSQELFKLLPGDNDLTVQGGANARVTLTYKPSYHV